jgi:hypothetical protein
VGLTLTALGLTSLPSQAVSSTGEATRGRGVVVHGTGKQVLPARSYGGKLPSFVQRTVTSAGAVEPPLAFSRDGSLFFASTTFAPGTYPLKPTSRLLRSRDLGRHWTDSTPSIAGVGFDNQGGDPVLYREELTGRLFYMLYFGGGLTISWTDDDGATWSLPAQVRVTEPGGITDYPRIWTSRPVGAQTTPAGARFYVHLCYNALYRTSCQRSIDGGSTFVPSPPPYPEAVARYAVDTCWSFHTGWAISSPVDGTIYMPKPFCGALEVASSRDNGLTWTRTVVPGAARPEGLEETRLAMDAKGNLYYLWMDAKDYSGGETVMLSVSRDKGRHWSRSVDVGAPGITATKLPSIVAGDEGRIALSYVGTTTPGGWKASAQAKERSRWDAYVAVSLNALSSRPVFATALVNPPHDPLRRGPCEGRCTVNDEICTIDCAVGGPSSGMYDYLQLALDPRSGALALSLVDLCAGRCGTAAGSAADKPAFLGAVGVQTGGDRLRR